MKRLIYIATWIALFLLALPAYSAVLESGKSYTVPEGERVIDDVYFAGELGSVNGTIDGDAIFAAEKILVQGKITGDAMLAGGTVNILGSVTDDVRVAGGEVTIGEDIKGDVIVFAGSVDILPEAVIDGDVIIFAETANLQGTFGRDVRIFAVRARVNAEVSGTVHADVSMLDIGEKARISRDLIYAAEKPADVSEGAVVGGETLFSQSHYAGKEKKMLGGFFGFLVVVKFVGLLIAGVLAVTVFKHLSRPLITRGVERLGHNMLWGFATLVLMPLAALIFAFGVVTLYISAALLALYLLLFVIAGISTPILVGSLLSKLFTKEIVVDVKWMLIGLVALFLIILVPFIGWLCTFLFFLASLGACTERMYAYVTKREEDDVYDA